MYRYVAASPEGFVQHLAVGYVAHGHWFYVQGSVPERKDPKDVDRKLIERYGIDISRAERSRRKRAGRASVQYLRLRRDFILVATHGQNRFFEEEAMSMRDCRRKPIQFCGHSISHRGGHASVRIEQMEYRQLKAHFLELACHRGARWLGEEFRALPHVRFAPVRQQILAIWKAVNRERKAAGFELVPFEALTLKRRLVRPFANGTQERYPGVAA